jgi:8-oxo-dGTP pyrophosphatase MutT (NUDIX family)
VTEPIERPAARVLVVDESDRILLFHGADPARPSIRFWFTPGGGLDVGESPTEGAARELYEETGLRVPAEELGEPVFADLAEFPFDGIWYRCPQLFFLVRVPVFDVAAIAWTELEQRTIDAHRWWTIEELISTDEKFYPESLPDLLRGLLARDGARPSGDPARPSGDPARPASGGLRAPRGLLEE